MGISAHKFQGDTQRQDCRKGLGRVEGIGKVWIKPLRARQESNAVARSLSLSTNKWLSAFNV